MNVLERVLAGISFLWSLDKVGLGKSAGRSRVVDTADALDALAAALQDALAPVTPPSSFREVLADGLADVAENKRSPRVILQRPPDYRRSILIGAIVSTVVSLAGLITVVWLRRIQRAS